MDASRRVRARRAGAGRDGRLQRHSATAEQVDGFGTGAGDRRLCASSATCRPDIPTDDLATTEDQGAIPIATDTGIPADTEGVTVESGIGDGPHGRRVTAPATSTSSSSARRPAS